jgi:hypothetical protein
MEITEDSDLELILATVLLAHVWYTTLNMMVTVMREPLSGNLPVNNTQRCAAIMPVFSGRLDDVGASVTVCRCIQDHCFPDKGKQ